MNREIMLGYDFQWFSMYGEKLTVCAPIDMHLIVVGNSGSGKSTAILYWLFKLKKYNCSLYIADFKKSNEFCGISDNVAEFENCYKLIKNFYSVFLETPEGGDGTNKILIIDEIAGFLTHFSMTKEGKAMADDVRRMLSSILMLGRSRKCFLWLSMQRYTASIFPSASGSADNFGISVGMGHLSVDGRKGLFAGEHFEGEDELMFGKGKGIVLIDGRPLRGIIIPTVSKKKLLTLLQK